MLSTYLHNILGPNPILQNGVLILVLIGLITWFLSQGILKKNEKPSHKKSSETKTKMKSTEEALEELI